MAGSIRDLKVWQEAVSLAAETVRSARQGARRETKVVTDQIMASDRHQVKMIWPPAASS